MERERIHTEHSVDGYRCWNEGILFAINREILHHHDI